jgi:hypothetical protein
MVRLPSTTRSAIATPAPTPVTFVVPQTKRIPGEIEMPWIWRALREQVYSRMPSYEERHGRSVIKLVLSPVVVKSLSDTVPGLGVAGHF